MELSSTKQVDFIFFLQKSRPFHDTVLGMLCGELANSSMCFRMGIQDKSLSSHGHYHFIMSFSLFCRRLHLVCLTSSSVQGSSIDTLNSTNSARKANSYVHSKSTNVVQRPQFLGMDIEWILSFWHRLRRINILLRRRWKRLLHRDKRLPPIGSYGRYVY